MPEDRGKGLGNAKSDTIYRLAQGVERRLVADPADENAAVASQCYIWVMYDVFSGSASLVFNHIPGGGNVLYMDGHVEFLKFPGIAPYEPGMGEATMLFRPDDIPAPSLPTGK
jgi:prepilin-type processing-associated H-X9-DG protein